MCTSLFVYNSCALVGLIFNQKHELPLPQQRHLRSTMYEPSWGWEKISPLQQPVNHMKLQQLVVDNNPINSQRTKSSPALRFFLVQEVISLRYSICHNREERQLQFPFLVDFFKNTKEIHLCSESDYTLHRLHSSSTQGFHFLLTHT